MRFSIRTALVACVAVPAVVAAQGPASCSVINRDGCYKADDLYSYMLPQLGLGIAGGNPVLGSSKAIGKLGHFSIGVRATAVKGSLPQFDNVDVSASGQVNSNIPTKDQWIPMPAFDAAIGLFNGFQVGVTRVAQLDALVSFIYVPDLNNKDDSNSGDASITVEKHTRVGFGGRLGLIEESVVIPGVSFAYLSRGLPKISVTSTSDNQTTFGVNHLDVNVATWRLMATKSFMIFGLSVGIGGDNYKSSGDITATSPADPTATPISLDRSMNRTNWFADLTINAGPVKFGFEYGGVGSASVTTFNTFTPAAGAAQNYASFGVRLGW
jgi:hypothetical protein